MRKFPEIALDLKRALFERPDELVLDIGAGGELLVARVRVVATGLVLLLPLINLLTGGGVYESFAGAAGAGGGFALALLWLWLAKRRRRYRWLSFVTGASDVTMTTLVLALLAAESPASGLNTVVVWMIYPLAIFATALRNDGRTTLTTGLLALLQYGALIAWVFARAQSPADLSDPVYGLADISSQAQRLVLIVLATLLTAAVVYRMQRLVMQSGTDGLTGLSNRSFLIHRVPQLVADAREEGVTLTLALIDLDHFKRINEDFGHPAGDRALKHVVNILRDAVGRQEPLIRVGGEEFVLLLRLPMGAAWERVEMLRRRVAERPFTPEPGAESQRLTFSAGLSCCPHDAVEISGLMRRADLRLRIAKQNGRNRVVARE